MGLIGPLLSLAFTIAVVITLRLIEVKESGPAVEGADKHETTSPSDEKTKAFFISFCFCLYTGILCYFILHARKKR